MASESPAASPLTSPSGRPRALPQGAQPPLLLAVEAIIGAGKSTLLEALGEREDVVVVREPLDLWQQQRGADGSDGGESLLDRYYGDQKAFAFAMETYSMFSRVKALRHARSLVTPRTKAIVMERSWLSSRRCFAENSKELGHLDALEASLHDDLFQWGLESWPRIDGVVFIDLDVGTAQGRVATRGRTAESSIPSDYQSALAAKHREWLDTESGGSDAFTGAVLRLDGNKTLEDGALKAHSRRVVDFIAELGAARAGDSAMAAVADGVAQDLSLEFEGGGEKKTLRSEKEIRDTVRDFFSQTPASPKAAAV